MRHIHDGDRRYDAKAVLTRISLAKNAFVAPDEYKGNPADDYDAMTAEVYPKYQETLRACAAFDFDDLIVEPVRLFQRDAEVKRRWGERFHYVMVDEFQDTNKAQLRMVQAARRAARQPVRRRRRRPIDLQLARRRSDEHLEFDRMFPGAKIVKLEQNYRSTKHDPRRGQHGDREQQGSPRQDAVVAARRRRADHARGRARPPRTKRSGSRARSASSQKTAGRFSDVAILYRSNIQSKILEEELRTAEVPYVMYGGQQFFERKEVKDVIAYLRVALNPRDELALRRVINYPARGIGATTVEKLVLACAGEHTHAVGRARRDRAIDGRRARRRARRRSHELVTIIERARRPRSKTVSTSSTRRRPDRGHRLYDDLRAAAPSMSAAQRRIDNVDWPAQFARALGARRARAASELAEYLRMLSLDTSDDEKHDDNGDKVVLTTLHGAKGLEFPVCFMIGLEEELLPHIRTLQPQATDVLDADHATDISEERRLCYVGITRAQRKLYLTRACTRVSRGARCRGRRRGSCSRFPTSSSKSATSPKKRASRFPKDEVAELLRELRVRRLTPPASVAVRAVAPCR